MNHTMSPAGVATVREEARPVTPAVPGPASWVRGGGMALIAGGALGSLTDGAQDWLPWSTSSLANSGGSWVLVSFLLALTADRVGGAVVRGGAGMVGLVAGYYVTAACRGVAVASSAVDFWILAALVLGPLVGLVAGWVRHGSTFRVALGTGVLGGLLTGEAFYGLRYIYHSTSPAYWVAQAGFGLGLMLGLVAWRARRLPAGLITVLTAFAVGAATVAAYIRS